MKKIVAFQCFIAWLITNFSLLGQIPNQVTSLLSANALSIDSIAQPHYIQNHIKFSHNYPFIQYHKNFIEWENYNAIAPFFEKLQKSNQQKVKIFHIGDSHIQADMYPNHVRQKIHDAFGFGGRGLVFPYSAAKTHAGVDYVTFAKGYWEYSKNVQWIPKHDLGMAGITVHTKDQRANFMLRFKDDDFNKTPHVIKIYCKKSTESFDLQLVTSNLEDTLHIDCNDDSDGLPYVQVQIPAAAGEILQFSVAKNSSEQKYFECYGLLFETPNEQGVIYNSVGVNGAGYRSLGKQNLFPQQLAELKPDLVVIDMGINDIYPLKNLQKIPQLESQVKEFIQTVRTYSPQSSILIMSVQEACHRRKNVESTYECADLLRKIAFENNCAFYDFFEVSGSRNSMQRWQKSGLAKKDFLHLTAEGYQHKGELLGNAILNAYYLSLTKKDSIQHFTLKDAIILDSINHHHDIFVQNLPQIDSSVVALLNKPAEEEIQEDLKLSNGKLIYTIKNGDNLGSIARHFGVTVKQLQKWNNLRSTRLRKGQTLAIYNKKYYQLGTVPETAQLREQPKENTTTTMVLASHKKVEKQNKKNTPTATIKSNVSVHIVKNGDSLWKIAQKYHTTVEKIKSLNSLASDKLSLGQQLKVK